ncbi:MAG: peptidoglycan-binding domain-containing protein [Clostridia bacterium]
MGGPKRYRHPLAPAFLEERGLLLGDVGRVLRQALRQAVRRFQGSVGITQDGVVGPVTMYHIGQVYNKPASNWP